MDWKLRSVCVASVAVLLLVLAGVLPASADPGTKGITEITAEDLYDSPYVITLSGHYRLADTIRILSGDGIIIRASKVLLDMNGHALWTESAQTGHGVVLDGVREVEVRNGKFTKFAVDVQVINSVNIALRNLQIDGLGTPPSKSARGLHEVGIELVDSRSVVIEDNVITAMNAAIALRGSKSVGNRIVGNTISGSDEPVHHPAAIVFEAAAGEDPRAPGPQGNLVADNHISRFRHGVSLSTGSTSNVFRNNVMATFKGGFADPRMLAQGTGNLNRSNLNVIVPRTSF